MKLGGDLVYLNPRRRGERRCGGGDGSSHRWRAGGRWQGAGGGECEEDGQEERRWKNLIAKPFASFVSTAVQLRMRITISGLFFFVLFRHYHGRSHKNGMQTRNTLSCDHHHHYSPIFISTIRLCYSPFFFLLYLSVTIKKTKITQK